MHILAKSASSIRHEINSQYREYRNENAQPRIDPFSTLLIKARTHLDSFLLCEELSALPPRGAHHIEAAARRALKWLGFSRRVINTTINASKQRHTYHAALQAHYRPVSRRSTQLKLVNNALNVLSSNHDHTRRIILAAINDGKNPRYLLAPHVLPHKDPLTPSDRDALINIVRTYT